MGGVSFSISPQNLPPLQRGKYHYKCVTDSLTRASYHNDVMMIVRIMMMIDDGSTIKNRNYDNLIVFVSIIKRRTNSTATSSQLQT